MYSTIAKAHRILLLALIGVSIVLLSGCPFPPRIYRMDVRQGNHITPDMVAKLKTGMSQEQVRDILGSPTLPHTINCNRWDYYYYFKPGTGGDIIRKHLTVYFRNGKLVKVEGDYPKTLKTNKANVAK